MKTVLIYVLSSHKPPYDAMIETSMQTWDKPLDGTHTAYYCGEPTNGDTQRVISFPIEEDYLTIGRKDLMAYAKALEWEWDFMARVNASCYVHKRRLLEYVQDLPSAGVMKGIISPPTPVSGTNRAFMWGGGQFLMSRDVVCALVAAGDRWNHNIMEDVAMSELAQDVGYQLDGTGKVCSISRNDDRWSLISYNGCSPSSTGQDFGSVVEGTDQFFFRVKNDADRKVDAEVMHLLKKHLTP